MKSLISLQEAKQLLFSQLRPIAATERVELLRAHARVLAERIVAPLDVPPFARAAMDGYAVRAEDSFSAGAMHPVSLQVGGFAPAGQVSSVVVSRGNCVQVATGSPLPEGADAVVMVEDTETEGEAGIRLYKAVHPGANVSAAGADMKKGTEVLVAGDLLTPARLGTVAALGIPELEVYLRPRVAVISSGEEIVSPGESLAPGKIYDINSYTIAALVEEHGCVPLLRPKLGDRLEDIVAGVRAAMDTGCDLIVVTGGSSVGERDLVGKAIAGLGRLLFHGIAVKPGKPTLAADIEGRLLIGMPGYPTSCLTNGYELLVPLLRQLARLPQARAHRLRLPMARRITSTLGRYQLLPVALEDGQVVPVFKESGAITSMSQAAGYVAIPANVDLLEKGDEVEVILL